MNTKLWFGTVLLAACVSPSCAQTLLFKDDFSDPKLTGWVQIGVPAVISNLNQQVLLSANCGPFQTNNQFAAHVAYGRLAQIPLTLTNNWTLEGRIDLVSASQNEVWGSMHFLWNARGGSGYVFWKDEDELALNKFWNGTSMAWFFHEQRPIKNRNVTLVLSFTRRDANLVINTRVLDKDNANAVLFDRTVIDTPQADPVLPTRSMKGMSSVNDEVGDAWRMISGPAYVEVTLDWTNSERAPNGAAQIIYDNVGVRLYQSPRLSAQPDGPGAVLLSWPLTQSPFLLENAPSVTGPWKPVPDLSLRTNTGQNEVSVLAPESLELFRLRLLQ